MSKEKTLKPLWFQGFRARYLNWLPTMAFPTDLDTG